MTSKTARKKTRKLLFQKLYAALFTAVDDQKFIEAFYEDIFSYTIDTTFFDDAYYSILENQKTISAIISHYAPKFDISIMNKSALVALSIGIYDIFFNANEVTQSKIIINESVEIVKVYADSQAKGLVHAVLHKIIQDAQKKGTGEFLKDFSDKGIQIFYGPK